MLLSFCHRDLETWEWENAQNILFLFFQINVNSCIDCEAFFAEINEQYEQKMIQ